MKRWMILMVLIAALPRFTGAESGGSEADEDWSVITSDGNLFMDYLNNTVTFYNNVVVRNPRGNLEADRLIVYFSGDGKTIEKTEGIGNVRIRVDDKTGRAERFLYFPDRKTAIMLGNARVTAGENTVRGGKITFYLDREEMEVEESPDIRFLPEEDVDVEF